MWIEKIKKFCAESASCEYLIFSDPVNSFVLYETESAFDISLPEQLKQCLLESNGVEDQFGLGLIWNIERIVEVNSQFRKDANFVELYMPFDNMMFFADAGNGDQFFFPILGNRMVRDDIYVWGHEDDSRSWAAPNLEKYLEWWMSGKLTV